MRRCLKTWASLDNDYVNIENFEREVIKERKNDFICIGCGKKLIPNVGEKKGRYFRHAVNNEKCNGGVESVCHKLAKDCFSGMNFISLPETYYNFERDQRVRGVNPNMVIDTPKLFELRDFDIFIEKNLTNKIRPDITLVNNNILICIEIFVTNKKSSNSIIRYNNFIKANFDKYEYIYVVELDLRNLHRTVTINDYENKIKEYIIQNKNAFNIIASKNILKADIIKNTSEYVTNNKEVLCPIYNNTRVFSIDTCRHCKFCVNVKNNTLKCYGFTSIITKSDFLNLITEHKYSLLDLENPNSTAYDELKDKYSSILDDMSYLYNTNKKALHLFGYCKQIIDERKCNNELKLAIGLDSSAKIKGKRVLPLYREVAKKLRVPINQTYANSSYLFRYCDKCGVIEPLRCPVCGHGYLKLLKNRHNDKIYIGCEHYLTEEDKAKGRTNSYDCPFTITFYESNSTLYNEEILSIGCLDNLYSDDKDTFIDTITRLDATRHNTKIINYMTEKNLI